MKHCRLCFLILFIACGTTLHGQEPGWQKWVEVLCDSFSGRGYVDGGCTKAATYLSQQLAALDLKPLNGRSYAQNYQVPVNTFPGTMSLVIDGKELQPGVDFLVDPASAGLQLSETKLASFAATDEKASRQMNRSKAAWITNADTFLKGPRRAAEYLAGKKGGLVLLPQKQKPLWWVAGSTLESTIVYVYDSSLLSPKRVSCNIAQQYIPAYQVANLAGYVPGTTHPDSFVVISAHYDHLGKMGSQAVFPGASDNASGVAMALRLAAWYAQNPQPYSVALLLFSGEEAGLLGSQWFLAHPLLPLDKIKFLLNIDIMGDATEGITVVNATKHPEAFQWLQQHNAAAADPLPKIVERGPAANSDHYFFSEAGVPAIFIYSNGGKGYYHDVWDRPETLSYKGIDQVYSLLRDFVAMQADAKKEAE